MKKTVNLARQRGISFVGLIFWGAFLGLSGVLIAQVAPTVIEYRAVVGAVNKSKTGVTPGEIRNNFDKYADVDGIRSLTGKDLEITKAAGDKTVIRFEYNREVHLAGPAYLLIKYRGESD